MYFILVILTVAKPTEAGRVRSIIIEEEHYQIVFYLKVFSRFLKKSITFQCAL